MQLIDKDPGKAISMFWAARNAGDHVVSALKDMTFVMKQLDRLDEAIEAIKSFRHLCPDESWESLNNVLIELYKSSGRIEKEIELLQHKMQQNDCETVEPYSRQALSLETDTNKLCNLAICLMHTNKMTEAKFLLQAVEASAGNELMDSSYAKSYERTSQMLTELEPSSLKENLGSLPGVGVSCAHQKAYASPVMLTQPSTPYRPYREQRRERWGNYGPGCSNKL